MGEDVKSNNLGPNMAGAKNLRKMNPDMTEYRTSLLFGNLSMANSFKTWNNSHIKVGQDNEELVIDLNTFSTYS